MHKEIFLIFIILFQNVRGREEETERFHEFLDMIVCDVWKIQFDTIGSVVARWTILCWHYLDFLSTNSNGTDEWMRNDVKCIQ